MNYNTSSCIAIHMASYMLNMKLAREAHKRSLERRAKTASNSPSILGDQK